MCQDKPIAWFCRAGPLDWRHTHDSCGGPDSPMPINSMTGFSRADGALGSASWHWELKSVNGRGLDVRCRMPQGLEALEQKVRASVSAPAWPEAIAKFPSTWCVSKMAGP